MPRQCPEVWAGRVTEGEMARVDALCRLKGLTRSQLLRAVAVPAVRRELAELASGDRPDGVA
jgi:hypothetical protein